jgi:hypothetical protein
MNVFVSYRYDPTDEPARTVLNWVDSILSSFNVDLIDGKSVGGAQLNETIRGRIRAADAVLAIFTAAAPQVPGGPPVPTSEYVRSEYDFAVGAERPAITIVLPGVTPAGGVLGDHERIDLDLTNPSAGLIKLVATIGLWRQRAGRTVLIRLQPDEVGYRLAKSGVEDCCSVRLTSLEGDRSSDWCKVRVRHMQGGAFIRVPGVRDDSLIQIEGRLPGKNWKSVESEQWVAIPLDEVTP